MINSTDALEWAPYSVPLEVAQERVANWIDRDLDAAPINPTEMRAFLVRREDFVELLAQHNTEFVRMYIGRKHTEEGLSGEKRMRPCLLLVSAAHRKDVGPVPAGEDPDQIIDLIGHRVGGDSVGSADEDYQVFDFSRTCPPVCDEDSPLFIGKANEHCS